MRKASLHIICVLSLFLLNIQVIKAQDPVISGNVYDKQTGEPIPDATVFVEEISKQARTELNGSYSLSVPPGEYTIKAFYFGFKVELTESVVGQSAQIDFYLQPLSEDLLEVKVQSKRQQSVGMSRLRAVEGYAIYEAKKNELIILDDFAANKVTNNARQVFAKVPGLNIWESDCAGLQLDIAARGLGPSRTANFNTRQNGYDMSADALGYPESYYLPSMQAIDRIEIIRGAASLQYGSQFGGMLNFKLKDPAEEPLEVNLEQSIGSFGITNSFASFSGTVDDVSYYTYYQYRQGDCWRENSGFDSHLAFAKVGYEISPKLKIGLEYSFMDYITQQPGGLTDFQFENGSLEESRRNRNWFSVNWNLIASTLDYKIDNSTKFNLRSFVLLSSRNALGNLEQIVRADDPNSNRTLIRDQFSNFGTEARLLKYFNFLDKPSALVVGARYFNGLTDRKQGDASASAEPDFNYLNPDDLEDFDYDFPSQNVALFGENVLNLSDDFSLTQGIRYEYISTNSNGTWKQTVRDFAGNITAQNEFFQDETVNRDFVLLGLGASYYLTDDLNLYANFSQNYRSVTFTDLRLNNPNFVLDSAINDERGYNADLGIRGNLFPWLTVDASLFLLQYNDRLGVLLQPNSTILLRSNIGDSRHLGLEYFMEADVLKLIRASNRSESRLSIFTNFSLINAEYVRSDDTSIEGNRVEYVPNVMFRGGINYNWKGLKSTIMYSYLGDQFSDATNSTFNPNALTGLVPSYSVLDLSFEYHWKRYKVTTGVNNLTNTKYFTRRAASYPGPGIIPATPRSYYLSVGVKL